MNGRLFAVVLIGMEAAAGGAYSAAPVAVSSGMPLSVWTNKAGRVVHDFGQDAFGLTLPAQPPPKISGSLADTAKTKV